MRLDVHLEYISGNTLACVDDSAGILGSVLRGSEVGVAWLSNFPIADGRHFQKEEVRELVDLLRKLMELTEGNAGRRHLEQVISLAERCQKDRGMRLSFIPRVDSVVDKTADYNSQPRLL